MVCCSSIVPLRPQRAQETGVCSASGMFGTCAVSEVRRGPHWITVRCAAISPPSRRAPKLPTVSPLHPSESLSFRRTSDHEYSTSPFASSARCHASAVPHTAVHDQRRGIAASASDRPRTTDATRDRIRFRRRRTSRAIARADHRKTVAR